MANPLPYLNTSDPLQQSLNNLAANRINNVEPTQPAGSLEELQQFARDNGFATDSVINQGSPSNLVANEAIEQGTWPGYRPVANVGAPGQSSYLSSNAEDDAESGPAGLKSTPPIDRFRLSELDQKLGKELENPIESLMPSFEKEMNKKARDFMPDYLSQKMEDELDDRVESEKEAKMNELQARIDAGEVLSEEDIKNEISKVRSEIEDPTSLRNNIDRRFFNSDGSYNFSMGGPNLFGFTAQRESGGAARDLQDYYYRQKDLSGTQVKPEGPDYHMEYDKDGYAYLTKNGNYVNPIDQEIGWNNNLIDDGINPDARESLFITGEEYINQRNVGLPGRPVENIDPSKIYNKQDEQDLYGYIPYLTSEESVSNFHDSAAPHALSNVFNDLRNLRRDSTDFTIDIGDNQKVSGKDFTSKINEYKKKTEEQRGDPSRIVSSEEDASEYAIPFAPKLITDNGEVDAPSKPQEYRGIPSSAFGTYIGGSNEYGEPADADTYNNAFQAQEEGKVVKSYFNPVTNSFEIWSFDNQEAEDAMNESIVWTFDNGEQWIFENQDDFDSSINYAPQDTSSTTTVFWKNLDPMELDDGTKIRSDRFDALVNKDGEGFWENQADYGPLNWNKPYIENPIEEGGWLPWFADIALGSAPLFTRPTAYAQAIPAAMTNASGMQPGYADPYDRTYQKLSDNPTMGQVFTSMTGNLALPSTERLWGNIGGHAFTPVERAIADKTGKEAGAFTQWLLGATGEGMEEIPGNIVEEYQRNGLRNFYANDLTDEDGNVIYDNQGYALKNPNTNFTDRAKNFAVDIPLSFIGGFGLGGGMAAPQAIGKKINSKINGTSDNKAGELVDKNLIDNNLIRNYAGNPEEAKLTEDEIRYYNKYYNTL